MENSLEHEIWMPVHSKPGIMASSMGRILLPTRTRKMPNGGESKTNPLPTFGVCTKASKNALHKYMGLQNRFYGNMKVHRLICEAFHGAAPSSKHVVIHIDENALNNRADNLRWGTQKENLNMPKFVEYCKSRIGEKSPVAKHKAKLSHATQAV